MSNIEVLKELHDRELLKPLVAGGIIPAKVLTYTEMFYSVDAQLKSGVKRKQSVCNTAAAFSVTPMTVYRAIKSVR